MLLNVYWRKVRHRSVVMLSQATHLEGAKMKISNRTHLAVRLCLMCRRWFRPYFCFLFSAFRLALVPVSTSFPASQGGFELIDEKKMTEQNQFRFAASLPRTKGENRRTIVKDWCRRSPRWRSGEPVDWARPGLASRGKSFVRTPGQGVWRVDHAAGNCLTCQHHTVNRQCPGKSSRERSDPRFRSPAYGTD